MTPLLGWSTLFFGRKVKQASRAQRGHETQVATLAEVAARVHKDFIYNLKYARVWGAAVHDGQMVQRDYRLHDGDVDGQQRRQRRPGQLPLRRHQRLRQRDVE